MNWNKIIVDVNIYSKIKFWTEISNKIIIKGNEN